MPFTLAHPSIVLPFKSKYFNLTALILGSMAPDFIYFLLFSPSSNLGHTMIGFILFNLPMCFLINYVFFKYMKDMIIWSMPKCISDRYMYITKYENNICNKADLLKFVYSALIGMMTHILWDSFTHETGFFVSKISMLSMNIELLQRNIPIYKILQHGSTIVGFIIIFIYLYNIRDKYKYRYINTLNRKLIRISLLIVFIITMSTSILVFYKLGLYIGIGRLVVTLINSIIISYLIVGVFRARFHI